MEKKEGMLLPEGPAAPERIVNSVNTARARKRRSLNQNGAPPREQAFLQRISRTGRQKLSSKSNGCMVLYKVLEDYIHKSLSRNAGAYFYKMFPRKEAVR